jgi:hypothetical protein
MPRANLRHAQPIVRDFCLAHGLPYTQTSLLSSYGRTLRYLAEVGRGEASEATPAWAGPSLGHQSAGTDDRHPERDGRRRNPAAPISSTIVPPGVARRCP